MIYSVHFLCLLPDRWGDHLGVNVIDLWNSLAHQWSNLLEVLVSVDWVSKEKHVLDFWQLRKLCNLVPTPNPVVAREESVQLDAWVQTFKLLDLVV